MMAKYDVIIIGAGISGLCNAIMLAKTGKNVLIIEKNDYIGGRAFGTNYRGHVLDNGLHTPSSVGHLEDIFAGLGRAFPVREDSFSKIEVYRNGKWDNFMEILDRAELRKIITEISTYAYDEIRDYDEITLKDWLSERTKDEGLHLFFWSLAAGAMAANRYDRFSAGELFFFLKEHLDRTGTIGGTWHFWDGGLQRLGQELHAGLMELGVEIKTDTRVTGIVIKEGKACGVKIEKGDRIVPNQFLPSEMIKASAVICTLPIWDLFKVVNPDDLPGWYVEQVKSISRKVRTVWSITCAVDDKLESWPEEWTAKWVRPEDSRTGVQLVCSYCPGYAAEGDYQMDFFWQGDYDEVPDVFSLNSARTRHRAEQFIRLCEEDLKALFPDLERHMLWKVWHVSPFALAWLPGLRSGRPHMEVPGVRNLYLSSDTVRENRGDGMQSAARTARLCVERILNR